MSTSSGGSAGPDTGPGPGAGANPDVAGLGDVVAAVDEVIRGLDGLLATDWHGAPGQVVIDVIARLEQTGRRLDALRAQTLSAVEAHGLWALEGSRSMPAWLSERTGVARSTSSRWAREARALTDSLPISARAWERGRISEDHVRLLVRHATRTHQLRRQLSDPELGEEFLVDQAEQLDAARFATVVKSWATAADPQAADRAWREEGAQEELTIAATMGGYHVAGWLDDKTGRVVDQALRAHMGRRALEDARTPAQRRASALAALAHQSLDAGLQQSSARVRPHLTVTVPWHTLQTLAGATGTAIPPDELPSGFDVAPGPLGHGVRGAPGHGVRGPSGQSSRGASGSPGSTGSPSLPGGDEHVISTSIDHEQLRGIEPATFSDGTPLPPALLARLACESMLARVVFGADSTILDVGREQRIFPAHHARGVIARDRHCQYPGCHEGPDFGEIHHSLWWGKHQGPTSTDHGVLLCWHHHDLVHAREITITRSGSRWVFTDRYGRPIAPLLQNSDHPAPRFVAV